MKFINITGILLLLLLMGCSETTESGNMIEVWPSEIDEDITITSKNQWNEDYYSHVKTINGNLTVEGTGDISTITFESLTTINGNLTIQYNNEYLEMIEFPALTEVTGNITICSDRSHDYDLNSITLIGGDLKIWQIEYSLQSIDFFQSLQTIAGSLIIESNIDLTGISFPELTRVEGPEFSITGNMQLGDAAAEAVKDAIEYIADSTPVTNNNE